MTVPGFPKKGKCVRRRDGGRGGGGSPARGPCAPVREGPIGRGNIQRVDDFNCEECNRKKLEDCVASGAMKKRCKDASLAAQLCCVEHTEPRRNQRNCVLSAWAFMNVTRS